MAVHVSWPRLGWGTAGVAHSSLSYWVGMAPRAALTPGGEEGQGAAGWESGWGPAGAAGSELGWLRPFHGTTRGTPLATQALTLRENINFGTFLPQGATG